eukprot:TRINITY_DN61184_c0_g1_i1.p1 TRINITY_DN61184_c0_g1~~TRINITY_DN61184_c0_g1_i1.p1  ORF type:complete len:350 (+),score=101.66 TRINITY_DN61184_c0_g1_i1:85-1134(+)
MANLAGLQIAQGKFGAHAAQADLEAEVHRQGQLQAELAQSIARQKATEAEVKKVEAERGKDVAKQQLRYADSVLQENKIHLLLQGFDAILHVFRSVETTSALLLGFTDKMSHSVDMTHAHTLTKQVNWAASMLTSMLLVHSVFAATLAAVDGTKLAYQGTRGLRDVTQAFHGLMGLRSSIFWNFVAAFISWTFLLIGAIFVHLDNDVEDGKAGLDHVDIVYGCSVGVVFWFFPVVRMWWTYRRTRSLFAIDHDVWLEQVRQGDIDYFELDLGPQSIRKAAHKSSERREWMERRRSGASGAGSESSAAPARRGNSPASWTQLWQDGEDRWAQSSGQRPADPRSDPTSTAW